MKSVLRKIRRFIWRKKPVQKTYAGWANRNHRPDPTVSFVIQSHNRSAHVQGLVWKLRAFSDSEIIVIDDGSETGHTIKLARLLQSANEFLLRCNDLYEVITYDRALNLAKGKFVVLLQDDDDFDNLNWVADGIQHFEADPQLAILGGRDGAALLPIVEDGTHIRGPFQMEGEQAWRMNSFRIALTRNNKNSPGLAYVPFVNRAPMWFRRDLFRQVLQGVDLSFAPFQWDDAEICLRAWLCGLRVGHYSAQFHIGRLGTGGMQLWNSELHHQQDEENVKKLYALYGSQVSQIDALIADCNRLKASGVTR